MSKTLLLLLLPLLASTVAAGLLSDTIEQLRENSSSIKKVGNVDVIQTTDDSEHIFSEYGICHIPTILPFAGGTLLPIVQVAAATHLAIEHLNSGDGSIIPQVKGLNERCPIRFTTEMIDSQRSPAVAVDKAIEILSRENQTTCAITGAGRSPVISISIISSAAIAVFCFTNTARVLGGYLNDDSNTRIYSILGFATTRPHLFLRHHMAPMIVIV